MQVLSVVGYSDTGKTTLIERLVDRLSSQGTVGTVKHVGHEPVLDTENKETVRHRRSGAAVAFGIGSDGNWFATGTGRSLEETLDRLATDCDYVLLEGFSGTGLPQVRLGEREAGGNVVHEAVHGAAVDVDELVHTVEELNPYESLESLVATVKDSPAASRAGAIATVTGRVPEFESPEDQPTTHLEFERYDMVAAERRTAIQDELAARDGVHEVLLYHRTGVVEAGEDIVHGVVLAGHRAEAIAAVEDGIDRLKEEIPLFKEEVTVTDSTWAHER